MRSADLWDDGKQVCVSSLQSLIHLDPLPSLWLFFSLSLHVFTLTLWKGPLCPYPDVLCLPPPPLPQALPLPAPRFSQFHIMFLLL